MTENSFYDVLHLQEETMSVQMRNHVFTTQGFCYLTTLDAKLYSSCECLQFNTNVKVYEWNETV